MPARTKDVPRGLIKTNRTALINHHSSLLSPAAESFKLKARDTYRYLSKWIQNIETLNSGRLLAGMVHKANTTGCVWKTKSSNENMYRKRFARAGAAFAVNAT